MHDELLSTKLLSHIISIFVFIPNYT